MPDTFGSDYFKIAGTLATTFQLRSHHNMDKKEQRCVSLLKGNNCDSSDPHGYCGSTEKLEVNFRSPTKRSFLRECIRQIYILNGRLHTLPNIPNAIEFNRNQIWSNINEILIQATQLSNHYVLVERVKRQLFREPKTRRRKAVGPCKQEIQITKLYNFGAWRLNVGAQPKRIKRNYLDEARNRLKEDHHRRSSGRKRKSDGVKAANPLNIDTHEGIYQVSTHTISKICKYHVNMVRTHPSRVRSPAEQERRDRNTEACRLSRRAKKLEELLVAEQYGDRQHLNEKLLEETIRSIYYMKALLSLMVDHEENLYI